MLFSTFPVSVTEGFSGASSSSLSFRGLSLIAHPPGRAVAGFYANDGKAYRKDLTDRKLEPVGQRVRTSKEGVRWSDRCLVISDAWRAKHLGNEQCLY